MSGEYKEIIAVDVIDEYLKNRDIDGLYRYMEDKGKQAPELSDMLEIWFLEKRQQEKTIFWNVFSYQDAAAKYDMIGQVLALVINRQEVSQPIIQFIEKEVSVWAVLIWIMAKLAGMRKILAMEAAVCFWREHHYGADKIRILQAVYMENLQNLLTEALAHQDGYLAKRLLVKLPDKEQQAELLKKAEKDILKVEQKIQGRLYTPTVMEKIRGIYFIADCWHNRVLYSRELCDIKDWNVLDKNLLHPHSVCSGKELYAVENTEHDSICFYRMEEAFAKIGELPVGKRPHRILYDEDREIFWTLAGESQEIYGIRVADGRIELCFRQRIEELKNAYVRSMRMIDGRLYLVSGPGYILELSFQNDGFRVENKYVVLDEYSGMNDIIYFQGYFWITVYQDSSKKNNPALLRLPSLEDFGTEHCVNLYDVLDMKGIPYFFSWIDGKLCIPEIDTHSRIVLYDAEDGKLKVNQVLYDFGKEEIEDIVCKHRDDIEIREYVLE